MISAEAIESEKQRMATSIHLSKEPMHKMRQNQPVAFPETAFPSVFSSGLLSKDAALQIVPTAMTCTRLLALAGSASESVVQKDFEPYITSKMAIFLTCMLFCVSVPVLS